MLEVIVLLIKELFAFIWIISLLENSNKSKKVLKLILFYLLLITNYESIIILKCIIYSNLNCIILIVCIYNSLIN